MLRQIVVGLGIAVIFPWLIYYGLGTLLRRTCAAMIDDHGWYVPFAESFTSEALSWAKTGASFSFEKFPDAADRTKGMAAFQLAQER